MTRPRKVILRSRLLPTNEEISSALFARYQQLINGTSVKMGVRYQFSAEDRADLVSFAILRLHEVNWHKKIRQNRDWIEKNHHRPQPWAPWTMQEVFRVVGGYASRFIVNALIKEARRIRANGLGGLDWRHKMQDFPFHNDPEENPTPEQVIEDIESQAAAAEMTELAKKVLTPDEWLCVGLQFGMDGGGDRTPEQVAKQLSRPKEEVRRVLEMAMEKLQTHVCDDGESAQ